MGRISDERLKEPFKRVKTLDTNVNYIREAKEIAEMINRNEEIPQEKLERVRLQSIQTSKTNPLKGDFVINCFLDAMQFNRWKKGKMIHTNDREVEKIYHNHFSKELSVVEFCKRNPITRTKYYRIVNCDVQNVETRVQLQAIKDRIEKEYK